MITIRFYEELNDFLPGYKSKVSYSVKTNPGQTVKDLIESENVPHTEVDLILVNSNSVNFSYQVRESDWISVYPVFKSLDIQNTTKLRPLPLRLLLSKEPKFILDVNLGKLARYLRIGGFDALYSNSYTDKEIAEISSRENRIVLTRDRDLLKRSIIQRGHWIRSQNAVLQYQAVLERFDLKDSMSIYSRCPQCNGKLRQVKKNVILDRLASKTAMYFNNFKVCNSCGKIYWKGSHYYNFISMTGMDQP